MSAATESDAVAGVDAIRLQVLWSRLQGLVDEQAGALMRTAFSPIVRESGDLSAGVFDVRGRMLAQAITGTPGHVNTMADGVANFLPSGHKCTLIRAKRPRSSTGTEWSVTLVKRSLKWRLSARICFIRCWVTPSRDPRKTIFLSASSSNA